MVCRINFCTLGGAGSGGLAEWSNAPVLKTDGRESVPRVRIPEPPPFHIFCLVLTIWIGVFLVSPHLRPHFELHLNTRFWTMLDYGSDAASGELFEAEYEDTA